MEGAQLLLLQEEGGGMVSSRGEIEVWCGVVCARVGHVCACALQACIHHTHMCSLCCEECAALHHQHPLLIPPCPGSPTVEKSSVWEMRALMTRDSMDNSYRQIGVGWVGCREAGGWLSCKHIFVKVDLGTPGTV